MDSSTVVHDDPTHTSAVRSDPIRVTLDLKPKDHRALKRWCNQAAADLDLSHLSLAAVLRLLGEELIRSTRLARCIRGRLLDSDVQVTALSEPLPGSDVATACASLPAMQPVSRCDDEDEVLKDLDAAIEHRDHAFAHAGKLRMEAHHQFARRLGELVEIAMAAHAPMTPTAAARFLNAMQQDAEVPAAAGVPAMPGSTKLGGEDMHRQEKRLPADACQDSAPQQEQTGVTKALQSRAEPGLAIDVDSALDAQVVVLNALQTTRVAVSLDFLLEQLTAGGHAVGGQELREWTERWVEKGLVLRLGDGLYAHAESSAASAQPVQRNKTEESGAVQVAAVTARARALEIVQETDITAGITIDALMRQLGSENHAVYGRQVRNWLGTWVTDRKIRRLRDGLYIRAGIPADQFRTPTLTTSQGVPFLLQRAYQAVVSASGGEMSSRDLAAALDYSDSGLMGAELCAQMRAVGVIRPNSGKIRARINGAAQLGYTSETLGKAIAAYNAKETRSRAVQDRLTE
ncbi:hypothetical protein ACFC34_36150 [Streptomyces sp. NPDC056053]|uniref:hypothetical protein n=1 Tax=Streptomyces sp. NPDC056053 TaxID=3345696 RepID=UPI0035E1C046